MDYSHRHKHESIIYGTRPWNARASWQVVTGARLLVTGRFKVVEKVSEVVDRIVCFEALGHQ